MNTGITENEATVIDFHERRIQKIKKELDNSTSEDLYERIQKLRHSERAMERLMEELLTKEMEDENNF